MIIRSVILHDKHVYDRSQIDKNLKNCSDSLLLLEENENKIIFTSAKMKFCGGYVFAPVCLSL